jgi:hypothetical protein
VDARHKVYTWARRRRDPSAGHDGRVPLGAGITNDAVADLVDERVLSDPGNLVFDVQFLTFQFRNLEVVDRRMGKSFCDFLFKRVVPFFKFRKMRFNRHVACLLADGQIRLSYTLTIGVEDTPFLPVRKSPPMEQRWTCGRAGKTR